MKDIKFKTVTLEDKEVIESFLHQRTTNCLAAFTFSSLVSWERLYHYHWAISDDTLIMKLVTLDDKKEHLLQPFGEFPIALQNRIIRFSASLSYQLQIFGISNEFIADYPGFVSRFIRVDHRELDNYIYSAQGLAMLNGREFQAKRNLINQFEKNHHWSVEPVTAENLSDCFKVLDLIYNQDDLERDFYLGYELEALDFVLKHFVQLEEEGLVIRIDSKPVAFSIYEHLNASTYVVHFEKAIKEYKGLYQLVNRETARIIMSKGYKYINREEDLGIEGLRKAKLSYHPIELCPSIALVFNKDTAE
jgi:uncharacterized protein